MSSPFTLDPQSYEILEFEVPRRSTFRFEVSAEHPVSVYLVDEDGLAAFEAGDEFEYYAGGRNRRVHSDSARVGAGALFLIVDNEKTDSTAISYDVVY